MKKNYQSNFWIYLSSITAVVLVIAETISDILINNSSIPPSVDGPFAGLVCLGAVIVFVISLVAVFKTQKLLKVVPVLAAVVALVIFGLSFFAFAFSGYGSH